jgi:hypothetical protein
VLCFEVLIHQYDLAEYQNIVRFVAGRARQTLIVSGYENNTASIKGNAMLFFHEPLSKGLAKIGRFNSIREIGRHTDVVIYRCDVWSLNAPFAAISAPGFRSQNAHPSVGVVTAMS